MKKWFAGAVAAIGGPVVALVLVLVLALVGIVGAITSVVSGGLGAMFGDSDVKEDYGFLNPCQGGDLPGGPGAPGVPVSGTTEDYVKTIVGVGKTMKVSQDGQIIAVMTMLQESLGQNHANSGQNRLNYDNWPAPGEQYWLDLAKLSMNYPHDAVGNDADSVGLFQQRASAGWADGGGYSAASGNPETAVTRLLDPRWGVQQFYGGPGGSSSRGLLEVPGWESMPKGRAAQSVQGSAFPDAYNKWEAQATQLVAKHADAPAIPLMGDGAPAPAPSEPSDGSSNSPSGPSDAPAGPGVPPAPPGCDDGGQIPPDAGSPIAKGTVKDIFMKYESILGTPYSWGGGTLDGPSNGHPKDVPGDKWDGSNIIGFDCSSSVRYAVYQGTGGADGGYVLPRTSQQQYDFTRGHQVWSPGDPTSKLEPGDLLFFGSSTSNIIHVAMYAGNGMVYEEPSPGKVASINPLRTDSMVAGTRLQFANEEAK